MAKKTRSFSPAGVPEKQEDYHGFCGVHRLSPDIASKGIRSVNVVLTFEESLRLATALQSCILKLNRYNRSAKSGREMGLVLSLKTESNSMAVLETKLRTARKKPVKSQALDEVDGFD